MSAKQLASVFTTPRACERGGGGARKEVAAILEELWLSRYQVSSALWAGKSWVKSWHRGLVCQVKEVELEGVMVTSQMNALALPKEDGEPRAGQATLWAWD